MNKQNRTLVLLAAYNGIEWIEEQIESILNQRNVALDILISVDRSTDDTYQFCSVLAEKYSNIRLLDYGKRYGGAAANFFRLIKEACFDDYDYIALADQDDIWLEHKLSYSITKLDEYKADAFSSNVMAFWESGKQALVKKSYPQRQFDFFFESAGPGCTYVVKQEAMIAFKSFMIRNDPVIEQLELHDWTVYAFMRSQGYAWHIDALPLMMYRQHASNQVGYNYGLKAFVSRFRMIRNDWYVKQIKLYFLLFGNDVKGFNQNRIFMLTHFRQLRRRPRDAFFLLLVVLLGFY